MNIRILFITLTLCLNTAQAARLHTERHYQELWCEGRGQTEYILPDRARVDCLTYSHAIEFDFADKWAESIGQALYYAGETGKKAGVVLISENPNKDMRYIQRFHNAVNKAGLKVRLWIVQP